MKVNMTSMSFWSCFLIEEALFRCPSLLLLPRVKCCRNVVSSRIQNDLNIFAGCHLPSHHTNVLSFSGKLYRHSGS